MRYENGKLIVQPGDSLWIEEDGEEEPLFSISFANGKPDENGVMPLEMTVFPMHLNDLTRQPTDVQTVISSNNPECVGAKIVCH